MYFLTSRNTGFSLAGVSGSGSETSSGRSSFRSCIHLISRSAMSMCAARSSGVAFFSRRSETMMPRCGRSATFCTQVIGVPVPSSFILCPVMGLYFMNLPVLQLGDCFHLEQNVFCALVLCQRRLNLFPDVHSFNQRREFCSQEQLDFLVIN